MLQDKIREKEVVSRHLEEARRNLEQIRRYGVQCHVRVKSHLISCQ
jgi:hypothetical protein